MTKQATTPIRNNYAAPNTPITSVKRPRSSIERSSSNASSTPSNQKSLVVTNTPNQNMSPMHPARPVESVAEDTTSWVGRKVDAIFSPVLSFLTSGPKDDAQESAIVTDEDLQMEGMAPLEDSPPSVYVSEDKAMEEEDASIAEEVASEVEEEEEEDEFNPYLFIKTLPRYETVCHLRPPVTLPPKEPNSPPLTLVLDLDETLVHCTVEPTSDSDETFPVVFHGVEYLVHVKLRPHVFEFLESVCDKFEVVVFTASQRVYADELLNRLDPTGKFIQHRLFRDSCLAVEGNFLKDLTVLGRDMSKTVLVDNSPHAFGYQIDNGIPIESWFDDPNDTELLKLLKFLDTLHNSQDVRTQVRKEFSTYRKVRIAK